MNIFLLNTLMEPGGAQKAMLSLAKGLEGKGNNITVATMYDKDAFIPQFEKKYELKIIDLGMKVANAGKLYNLYNFLRGTYRLYKLLVKNKIDVLQTFSHYSNIIGPCIAFLARVKIKIVSQRMSLIGQSKTVRVINRIITNSFLVNKMTSVSEGTRKYSIEDQKINPKKILTIPNGIDIDKYSVSLNDNESNILMNDLKIPHENKIIVTVARLHPQKGHVYLLNAAKEIIRENHYTSFLFIGDGELKEELIRKVDESGLNKSIIIAGARDDIPSILAISDIFVLPTLWEGMPNSILEAMSASLPVIATNVDGCPEVVLNEITGFIIKKKNENELISSINKLLKDEQLCSSFGKAGFARAKDRFSPESTLNQYENLYIQELNGR